MKKWAIAFSLPIVVACASIKKESNPYIGEWVLVSKSGGFTGMTTKSTSIQEIKIERKTIKYYENGELKLSNEFKIEKGKTIQSSEPQDIILGNRIPRQSIQLHEDQLIIADQCFDCYMYVYKRK